MPPPRKVSCTVSSIIDHGGGVYTVDLLPAAPVPTFRPGQFLHLTVDPYDPSSFWPDSRVFSIASPPQERKRIGICYSVKGRYTAKMQQVLKVGGEVWIKLPYGDFVIDNTRDAVLIAGGTGISAFTAFLESLTSESKQKVILVYGARNPGLFLFQEMILSQHGKVPGFNVVFFTETADTAFADRMAALAKPPQCFTGRISVDTLFRSLSPDFTNPTSVPSGLTSVVCPLTSGSEPLSSALYYLSGPPIMLKTLSSDLQSHGLTADRIFSDAWE